MWYSKSVKVRSLLTAFVTAVLTATLVWGGCLSCQPAAPQKIAGGCCQPSGKCETPRPQTPDHKHCKASAAALQDYIQSSADPAPAMIPAPAEAASAFATIPEIQAQPAPSPQATPLALYVLHSTLLI